MIGIYKTDILGRKGIDELVVACLYFVRSFSILSFWEVYSISYWTWVVEEGNFRRRNQSTHPKILLSATLGEVLVQNSNHQSYQSCLFHQIIHIISLSSPFGVSNPSYILRSVYTTSTDLSPAPANILPQPCRHFKRDEKFP